MPGIGWRGAGSIAGWLAQLPGQEVLSGTLRLLWVMNLPCEPFCLSEKDQSGRGGGLGKVSAVGGTWTEVTADNLGAADRFSCMHGKCLDCRRARPLLPWHS